MVTDQRLDASVELNVAAGGRHDAVEPPTGGCASTPADRPASATLSHSNTACREATWSVKWIRLYSGKAVTVSAIYTQHMGNIIQEKHSIKKCIFFATLHCTTCKFSNKKGKTLRVVSSFWDIGPRNKRF